jgi:folate-binding protein YgfZ
VTSVSVASPLLDEIAGAVAVDADHDPLDVGVALHYGDPLREQRMLASGRGVVDLSHFGVVRVEGPDRLTWLHSLLSQHVEQLPVGEGTQALLLSPNGHVEQHLRVVDDGVATWLVTEPGQSASFADYLERMRFMLRVEVADWSADHAVVWCADADAVEALEGRIAVRARVPAARGVFVIVARADLVATVSLIGDPAGVWAFEALRVAAHEPRLGAETDHRTIPHEMGWIGAAVHLQKGCYRGQETVARVQNLGRPPRRLVMLHLDGSTNDLPMHGAEVELDGRRIGFVGTAVQHHELGPIALAVVKRAVDADAVLLVGGVTASQEVVVEP